MLPTKGVPRPDCVGLEDRALYRSLSLTRKGTLKQAAPDANWCCGLLQERKEWKWAIRPLQVQHSKVASSVAGLIRSVTHQILLFLTECERNRLLLVQGDWKTRKWKSEIGLFAKVLLMDKGVQRLRQSMRWQWAELRLVLLEVR